MPRAKDIVTGIVYAMPTERNVLSVGPDGPLGDIIINTGLLYATPDLSRSPIGVYSLNTITVAIGSETERRDASVELSFNKKYARKSWISKLKPPFKIAKQSSGVNFIGVNELPLGGERLTGLEVTWGIAAGTGRFIGAEGTATLERVLGTEFVAYNITVV